MCRMRTAGAFRKRGAAEMIRADAFGDAFGAAAVSTAVPRTESQQENGASSPAGLEAPPPGQHE